MLQKIILLLLVTFYFIQVEYLERTG